MKTFLLFTILCSLLCFSLAVNTVGACGNVDDCYSCTNSQDSVGSCGWCRSTTKSYCGLTNANCTDTSGDQPDEWIEFQNGGNPVCGGGCESAESCTECSAKPNCGYCHSGGGCTPVANAGSCDGAYTIGNCSLPCDYLDNCQNCLRTTDAVDCEWCSIDDTDPEAGTCAETGNTCGTSLLTDAAVCPAFPDTGAASIVVVGWTVLVALCSFLVI